MHGVVMLDRDQRLVAPAMIWPDQRSQRQVQEITERVGAERLYAITGSPLSTGFLAASVRWMQQEAPATWEQVQMLLLPKDYLRWRMTGVFATDPSDGAGALLLDEQQRDWSDELLHLLDIDRSHLPLVQPSDQIGGYLVDAAAAELGLPAGIPVVTGAADTAVRPAGRRGRRLRPPAAQHQHRRPARAAGGRRARRSPWPHSHLLQCTGAWARGRPAGTRWARRSTPVWRCAGCATASWAGTIPMPTTS